MGFCSCTVKFFLFVFNFIVVVCGVGLIVVGSLALSKGDDLVSLKDSMLTAPSIAIIVIGVVIFAIAFFGCAGVFFGSNCMVATYSGLLLTILIVEAVIAIVAFVYHNKIDSEMKKATNDVFDKYWKTIEANETVDSIQRTFECCGLAGPTYWRKDNHSVPWSCCKSLKDLVNGTQGYCPDTKYWTDGCETKVTQFFKDWLNVIGGVAIGLAVFEVLGVVFGLYLTNHMRHKRTV